MLLIAGPVAFSRLGTLRIRKHACTTVHGTENSEGSNQSADEGGRSVSLSCGSPNPVSFDWRAPESQQESVGIVGESMRKVPKASLDGSSSQYSQIHA